MVRRVFAIVPMGCFLLVALATGAPTAAEQATDILRQCNVHGGLVVHVGCGDGQLTAALRASEGYTVHGLDTDAANVRKARAHIRSLGLYGKVAVEPLDGATLPYVSGMANLVVADTLANVPRTEALRVLAPGGVLWLGEQKTVKPWPRDIDEWTHYLHDADNNAVARDTVVGPPRRLQWQCEPKWTRHHDRMSSVSALVSTGGRIFYIIDEGSTASIFLPSHWALVARDAFNGKFLWRHKLGAWYSRFKGLKDGPADAPRRLVAVDGRVYVTSSLEGPVVCLNAVTGETVREYRDTKGAEEILLSKGVLFVLNGPGSIGDGRRTSRPAERRTLVAIQADAGKTLWQATDVVAAATMAVDASHLYYFNFAQKHVACLDRATGKPLWTSDKLPTPAKQTSYFASRLVVHSGVVLFASGEHSGMTKSGGGEIRSDTLTALAAETGKTLWTAKHPPSGYSSPENVFVIDGTVWCDNSSNGRSDGAVVGLDLNTGQEKQRFPADQTNYWFHHRCYPGRATTNYIMTSRTGIEFIDFRRKKWDLNHWTRGACLYGIMPCNGLVYTPPAPCICYAETMLHSFNAFAPASGKEPPARTGKPRLTRGPAYDQPITGKLSPGDWPTYRGDNARTGASTTGVPAQLAPGWQTSLGGKLSSVTVAGGIVFVAAVDEHTVHALDAQSGRKLWHHTTGGRVDSPPAYDDGRVVFGSADGRVYCLRAADGALVWQFRAAPADRRLLAYEQIESLWPVHGNVMVRDGVAHFVAGRSAFVDGGMRFCRLDAKTGRLLSETLLDDRNPATGRDVQELVKWLNMPVGRPDVLSCDGERIYMRSQAFDLQGKRLAMGPRVAGAHEGQAQGGKGTHLFCPTGFLDDTSFHRTYWLFARTWSSGWCGYHVAGKYAPAGKIICVGADQVYVFGRQPQYFRWTIPMEFRLFAARKEWRAAPQSTAATRRSAPKKAKGRKSRGGPTPVTNQANYAWQTNVPILVRAMTLAGRNLFIAGPRDVMDERRLGRSIAGKEALLRKQEACLQGKAGAVLWAVSASDGRKLAEYALASPPVFDGMAAANGRLYLTTMDGSVRCFAAK